MVTKSLHNALSELYYSVHGFNNPQRLLKEVRKRGYPSTSLKQVEEWFSTQETPALFRQGRNKFPRSITISRSSNYQWAADLGMLPSLKRFNQGHIYFLICISTFSRVLKGVKVLKTKKSKTVAQALREIIGEAGVAPEVLQTDQIGRASCRERV